MSCRQFKGAQWDPRTQRVLFNSSAPGLDQAQAGMGQAQSTATKRAADGSCSVRVPVAEGERPGATALATLPSLGGTAEERAGAVLSRAALGSADAAADTE